MRRPHLLLVAAVLGGYAAHAAAWVQSGALNADEGFYALAAREVFAGRLPYRDFGYTQLPGYPYLQGLAMAVAGGHDLFTQRWLNALWGGLTLALIAACGRRTAGGRDWAWPPLALALLPAWIYFVVIGKTYALTGLLLVLTAGALALKRPGLRLAAYASFGSLAVLCRLPVAPAVAVLWLALVRGMPAGVLRRRALWVPPATGCLLLLPFLLAAREPFGFYNLGLHTSVLRSARLESGIQLAAFHLPSLAGLLLIAGRAPREWPPALWAGAVGALAMLIPAGTYADYATPCMALLALGIAQLPPSPRRTLAGGGLRVVCVCALLLLPPPHVRAERALLTDLTQCARHVAATTPPDAVVLPPEPLIATGACRPVLPGSELGPFSVTHELPPARAQRLRLLTLEGLRARVAAGEPDVIVLSRVHVNWPRSIPSLRRIPLPQLDELTRTILQGYVPTWQNPSFVVLSPRPGDRP